MAAEVSAELEALIARMVDAAVERRVATCRCTVCASSGGLPPRSSAPSAAPATSDPTLLNTISTLVDADAHRSRIESLLVDAGLFLLPQHVGGARAERLASKLEGLEGAPSSAFPSAAWLPFVRRAAEERRDQETAAYARLTTQQKGIY